MGKKSETRVSRSDVRRRMLLNLPELPLLSRVLLIWKGDLGNDGVPPLFGIKRSTSTNTWSEYVRCWQGLQQHPTEPATAHEASFRQFLIQALQKVVAQELAVLHYLSGHRMGLKFPVEATRGYWRDQDSDEPQGIEAFPLYKKHLASVLKNAQDILDQLTQPQVLMAAFGAQTSTMDDLCETITAKYQPEQSVTRLKPILGHSRQFLWDHMDEWAVAFSKGQGERTANIEVQDLRTAREKWVPGIRQALNYARAQNIEPPARVFDPQTLETLFQCIYKEENRKDADHPRLKASHCLDYVNWLGKTYPCPLPEVPVKGNQPTQSTPPPSGPITLFSILHRPTKEIRALTAAAVKHFSEEQEQGTADWSSTGINTTITDLLRDTTADLSFETVYLATLRHKGRIKPGPRRGRRPNDVGRRMNGWRIFLLFLTQTFHSLILQPNEQIPTDIPDAKAGDIGLARWCESQWGKEKLEALPEPQVVPVEELSEPQASSPLPPAPLLMVQKIAEDTIADTITAMSNGCPSGPINAVDFRILGGIKLVELSGVPIQYPDERSRWLAEVSKVALSNHEEQHGPVSVAVLKEIWRKFLTTPV